MTAEMYRQNQLFIGGEWVNPIDGDVVASIDPSTGKTWAYAAWGGPKDIDRAVAAFPDASAIYDANIATLERLGHDGWNALMNRNPP